MKTPKEAKVHQGDEKYQYTHKGDGYVKEAKKAHNQYSKGGKK